ncbi:MAG: hypothetical protein ACKVX7_19495 [Planctomycetota bacterium]
MVNKIRLESYSMGKGYVKWRVVYPPMAKKIRGLAAEFDSLALAADALKKFCPREQLDAETAALIEAQPATNAASRTAKP